MLLHGELDALDMYGIVVLGSALDTVSFHSSCSHTGTGSQITASRDWCSRSAATDCIQVLESIVFSMCVCFCG